MSSQQPAGSRQAERQLAGLRESRERQSSKPAGRQQASSQPAQAASRLKQFEPASSREPAGSRQAKPSKQAVKPASAYVMCWGARAVFAREANFAKTRARRGRNCLFETDF